MRWLGSGSSVSVSSSGGTACTKDDRSSKLVAGVTPGGFVRYPPASVRRLRLRPQRPSRTVGIAASDRDDSENKGIKAFGVTSRRKDTIMKRTPLGGRSANARIPSWASCNNSACDPGMAWNDVVGNSGGAEQAAAREPPVRCGSRAWHESPAAASLAEGRWERHDSVADELKTARLSVSTLSHCATTTTTIITAVVPTTTKVEHCEYTTPGAGQGRIGSRRSSHSSLATVLGTARQDPDHGGATEKSAELGKGTAHRSPKRPSNPTGKARSGGRPHGNGSVRRGGVGGQRTGVATAENWRWMYPNPWRTPLLVRCMRRPEPRGAQQQ